MVKDDLWFILTEECPPIPGSYVNQNVRVAYDIWIRANNKARAYILASISDVLAKKHESMRTTRQIIESLRGMVGQLSFSLMKEGGFVREHIMDMMVHFHMAKVNSDVIDEKDQLQAYQTMMRAKGLESEVNVTTAEKKGLSSSKEERGERKKQTYW
ncbi:uncharacterized protein LOC120069983 [Benincasa hispida]|uniref:uncharacterized protein LOC120069983 n=1 Tax=Benincasa hispida TaxID=102211 RepID=UPI001902B026|nr:uncharacterized protein LOC120069983 [Benincasa hispida]